MWVLVVGHPKERVIIAEIHIRSQHKKRVAETVMLASPPEAVPAATAATRVVLIGAVIARSAGRTAPILSINVNILLN